MVQDGGDRQPVEAVVTAGQAHGQVGPFTVMAPDGKAGQSFLDADVGQ